MHVSVLGQLASRQHDAGSMQFRCTHLIGVLEMIGISPEHGITGTASRWDLEDPRSSGQRLEPLSSAGKEHRNFEVEVCVIFRHAVQDHGDAPGQRNQGALGTTTARKLRRPGSQPYRPSAMHHDSCRLAQRASKVDVARLGDPARDVSLAVMKKRIGRAILARRVAPSQAVAIDKEYPAHTAAIIDARLARVLGKERFPMHHLPSGG